MEKRELGLEVAKRFLNLPYIWGGNDPMQGFDCSGLMVEILKSVGIIGRDMDYNANSLKGLFEETEILEAGNMVFYDWNKDGIIDHVEMIAVVEDSGEVFTIGASGGNSATTSAQSAIEQDAYVKIRPLQSGYVFINDPFKKKE